MTLKKVPKKITIKDVAKIAGVSHQLVSAVLSGSSSTIRYSAATKIRVEQAAKKLGFTHCILARSFKSNKSFLVGVMINHAADHMLNEALQGIQDQLVPAGITPLFLGHKTTQEERDDLQVLLQRQVDAMIIFPQGSGLECYEQVLKMGIPMVEIFSNHLQSKGIPNVNSDMVTAGYMATTHLLALGHQNIALLTHDCYRKKDHWDAGDHWRGYTRAMEEAKCKPRVFAHSLSQYMTGDPHSLYHCANEITDQMLGKDRPSAVVCYETMQALALLTAAKARGLKVPEDLSITGVDLRSARSLFTPQLTCFGTDARKMGAVAADLVLAQLRAEKVAKQVQVMPELFAGASTAKVR